MSRAIASTGVGCLLLLGLFAATPGLAGEVLSAGALTSAAVEPPGAGCLEEIFAGGFPLCGTCTGSCRSDAACKGLQAGALCNNKGGTCQVVGGCGLHDCCACVNAGLAALFSPAP